MTRGELVGRFAILSLEHGSVSGGKVGSLSDQRRRRLVLIEINFTLLIQAANFLLLIFLLNVVLYKPILKILEEREHRIDGQQAEAKKITDDSQALIDEYNRKLHEAKIEAMNAKNAARSQASEEAGRIIEEARKKAEEMVAQVQREIASEIAQAKKELEPELGVMAATIAEQILGRRVA